MDKDVGENASMGKEGGQERNLSFDIDSKDTIQVHVLGGF
jgi:hypothetical protein